MAPKSQLLRLAATAQREDAMGARRMPAAVVALDRRGRLPGRGAYLCLDEAGRLPRGECLRHALARKAFGRAFRQSVEVPAELVESVSR